MDNLNNAGAKQLRQYVEQAERLIEEQKGLAGDLRDKFLEAKSNGFSPKIMRRIIKERAKSKADRDEEEALFETYAAAVGLIGTPLQQYADRVDEEAASNVVRL